MDMRHASCISLCSQVPSTYKVGSIDFDLPFLSIQILFHHLLLLFHFFSIFSSIFIFNSISNNCSMVVGSCTILLPLSWFNSFSKIFLNAHVISLLLINKVPSLFFITVSLVLYLCFISFAFSKKYFRFVLSVVFYGMYTVFFS